MVNEATSSDVETFFVSTRLRNDIIEQVKERKLSVMYYNKLLQKMKAKSAVTRDLAFQILIPILMHSPKVRHLFVGDLHEVTDLVFGVRSELQGPEASIVDLKTRYMEVIEILANKYGHIYPHFGICHLYIKDQIRKERRSEKRMHGKETSPPPPKKKRSMEVLHEVVNEIIWALLKEIEILDTDMDVVVEMDDPSAPGMMSLDDILDGVWTELPPPPSQSVLEKRRKHEEAMHKVYLEMERNYNTLCNELIPTLERNQSLLLSRGTAKAHSNLDKVDDLLDRCRITMRRCKRIIYRFHERYGRKEEWL
ncbi:hypothetical protein WA171_000985 [Blastocystis sp. BT1]